MKVGNCGNESRELISGIGLFGGFAPPESIFKANLKTLAKAIYQSCKKND